MSATVRSEHTANQSASPPTVRLSRAHDSSVCFSSDSDGTATTTRPVPAIVSAARCATRVLPDPQAMVTRHRSPTLRAATVSPMAAVWWSSAIRGGSGPAPVRSVPSGHDTGLASRSPRPTMCARADRSFFRPLAAISSVVASSIRSLKGPPAAAARKLSISAVLTRVRCLTCTAIRPPPPSSTTRSIPRSWSPGRWGHLAHRHTWATRLAHTGSAVSHQAATCSNSTPARDGSGCSAARHSPSRRRSAEAITTRASCRVHAAGRNPLQEQQPRGARLEVMEGR